MSYPDRTACLLAAVQSRYTQAREVLAEAGMRAPDADVALLKAFDIMFDERKERLFQEELRQIKLERRNRAKTPMAERPART